MAYLVALYRLDRVYGGPEEGGWHYNSGELERIVRTFPTHAAATSAALRINAWLERVQSHRSPISSVIYDQSRFGARVCRHTAPLRFPIERPHYE